MNWIWRYFERNVRGSATANWAAYGGVLLILATAVYLLTPATPVIRVALEPRQESCDREFEGNGHSEVRLRILTHNEISRETICRILPSFTNLLGAYGGVDVSWAQDGRWDQAVSERGFQLVQGRSEQLEVLKPTIGDYYHRIAFYPRYQAHFVSIGKAPDLSEVYFKDLTLGLRGGVTSRSGYRLPMRALNERGIEMGERIARYGSHEELRRALEQGEVDVIGTYWSPADEAKYPHWRTTQIDDIEAGLSWYVGETESADPEKRCNLVALLREVAAESTSGYFSDLRVPAEIEQSCRAVE